MPEQQNFQIPQQLRELAEKNVEQARMAYGQLMEAMTQAVRAWSTAPSTVMTSRFKVVQERAIQFAKENADAGFALASELAKAKDPQGAGGEASANWSTLWVGTKHSSSVQSKSEPGSFNVHSGGCIATVNLGGRCSCLHCREGLKNSILMHRSRWNQPRVSSFEVQRLTLQIESCTARDYVAHGLVVPRRGPLELAPWLLNPEAHRYAFAGDEIFLPHLSPRRRTGLHLLDRCIRHG